MIRNDCFEGGGQWTIISLAVLTLAHHDIMKGISSPVDYSGYR